MDKHYYLRRYIDIFTTGMKNQSWCDSTHYVDLFSGAGIENVEGSGLEFGSPLIAAQAPIKFTRLHLCEKNPKRYEALKVRLAQYPQPNPPQLLCGDANELASEVAAQIPSSKSLSVAFLDPYGLHVAFSTLEQLTAPTRRLDLILYFPDHVDANRNIRTYLEQDESNLDRVTGGREWRAIIRDAPTSQWPELLSRTYVKNIKERLGYQYVDDSVRINRDAGRMLYRLIFCSRHERGGEFWAKISQREADGQSRLF